jgi:hypothetical protein
MDLGRTPRRTAIKSDTLFFRRHANRADIRRSLSHPLGDAA